MNSTVKLSKMSACRMHIENDVIQWNYFGADNMLQAKITVTDLVQ